jgi:tRNA U38,U39,U40 pseudouridine synthase TruA
MQRNPGAVTIEDALELAIVKAGGISPENAGRAQQMLPASSSTRVLNPRVMN